MSRQRKLDGSCYVDDFIFVWHAEYHGECLGMVGGCEECARISDKASDEQTFTHELLDDLHLRRQREADEFYGRLEAEIDDHDARRVQRQALSGMLWSKQFYHYDVERWINQGDG
ncbi:MAG: hypothetical protein ACK56F_10470, partial [bacterium]